MKIGRLKNRHEVLKMPPNYCKKLFYNKTYETKTMEVLIYQFKNIL